MGSSTPEQDSQPDELIGSLINDYFDRKQAGEQLTPQSFAAEHPELADELRPYLEGMFLVDRIPPSAAEAGGTQRAAAPLRELPSIEGYKLLEEIGRGGRPREAFGLLESSVRTDPSRWPCRALLAEFHRDAGNVQRADELQTLVEGDAPDTAEAWYVRSFATLDLHRALACAQEAVQRQPSHAPAWCRLTYLRQQTGDLDAALRGAEKLIELGEDARKWTLFRGEVLVEHGRFRQAIEEYTRLTHARPTDGAAYFARAHVCRRIKEYDKAVADYTKSIELVPEGTEYAWYFYQRATPLWILGRTDEAVQDYERVRHLLGRSFYSDARQFIILRQQGRQDEANDVLVGALRNVQEPWLERIFHCLAGQLPPDKLVAEAIARGNPEHICEAYYYAGEVCLLAGERAQARKWFEQCVQTGVQFDVQVSPIPMNEYELAQWRLDALFTDTPASPPEKN